MLLSVFCAVLSPFLPAIRNVVLSGLFAQEPHAARLRAEPKKWRREVSAKVRAHTVRAMPLIRLFFKLWQKSVSLAVAPRNVDALCGGSDASVTVACRLWIL